MAYPIDVTLGPIVKRDIERLKVEIRKLSLLERSELMTWMDQKLAGGLPLTSQFESEIKQSEQEMKKGKKTPS